ncbi:MAG: hypothetical protein M3Y71_18290, partial [Actinomycetota bacterium]|nr:hypothetical protein [Actinomycetota bacterium]
MSTGVAEALIRVHFAALISWVMPCDGRGFESAQVDMPWCTAQRETEGVGSSMPLESDVKQKIMTDYATA